MLYVSKYVCAYERRNIGRYARPVVRSAQHVVIVIAHYPGLENVFQPRDVLHGNSEISVAVINDFDLQRRA